MDIWQFTNKKFIRANNGMIYLFLWHLISHPKNSRFTQFFKSLNKDQFIPKNISHIKTSKSKNKKNMLINIEDIKNDLDKRTSLIIKNISTDMTKCEIIKFFFSLVKVNYIFVPEDETTHKILGYAFINVCDYKDIISLLKKLSFPTINTNIFSTNFLFIYNINNFYLYCNKKISLCYCNTQGLSSLIKKFGNFQVI